LVGARNLDAAMEGRFTGLCGSSRLMISGSRAREVAFGAANADFAWP